MADLINIKDVMKKTSLSRTAIWRIVEREEFPAPIFFANCRKKLCALFMNSLSESGVLQTYESARHRNSNPVFVRVSKYDSELAHIIKDSLKLSRALHR